MDYLIYLMLRGFSLFVNFLPEGFALWVGRQLGNVMYCLDVEHRKVALQNLHIAFGQEKSEEEKRCIAKKNFQNLGMIAVEFFRIQKIDEQTFNRKVEVEGLASALEILKKNKGALLLLGHFGNWELMGMMSRVIHNPILVIAKPIKRNKRVDQFIIKIREHAGLEIIPPEKASRRVIQALSQNRVVGILIDQRAKRREGIWVDFFGRKVPTTPGLAVLASKTKAPVIPVFMVRDGYGKHRLLIKEPLELAHTRNIKKDIETNTQLFNHILESMIRQYPDQWFWVHRRWERKKRVHQR